MAYTEQGMVRGGGVGEVEVWPMLGAFTYGRCQAQQTGVSDNRARHKGFAWQQPGV